MNKENLKLLIDEIEKPENPFNWANMDMCLGFYARKLDGNLERSQQKSLEKFLSINFTQAFRLYIGNTIEESKDIVEFTVDSQVSNEEHRAKAVAYLKGLL